MSKIDERVKTTEDTVSGDKEKFAKLGKLVRVLSKIGGLFFPFF